MRPLILLLVLALLSVPRRADACGGSFIRATRTLTDAEIMERVPFLDTEQVLVLFDPERKTEHFIREVRFKRATDTFGFVVPTPTRPEVAKVATAPWQKLRDTFPYARPQPPGGGLGMLRGAGGGAPGATPPAVEVLSVQRIGSFTAFVLAAREKDALDKWLNENQFQTTKATREWLAPYVDLGFYYVAFRYDAPKKAGEDGMTSETVRISFETPHVFYPYSEPLLDKQPAQRLFAMWLVSPAPLVPVARHDEAFARPWSEGMEYDPTPEQLKDTLGDLAKLAPAKAHVTTLRDWKLDRIGFGDVVMVPRQPVTYSKTEIDARRFLLPILDRHLTPDDASNVDLAAPAPSGVPNMQPSSGGCSTAGGSAGAGALVIVALYMLRRRPVAVLALALSCKTPEAPPVPAEAAAPATAHSASETPPSPLTPPAQPTKAERARAALAILEGRLPGGSLPVQAGSPGPTGPKEVPHEVQLGTVDDEEIRRILMGARARFRACYTMGLRADPNMEGKVVLKVKVLDSGEVESASVASNTGIAPNVAACAAARARTLRFTPKAAGKTIEIPLVFRHTK